MEVFVIGFIVVLILGALVGGESFGDSVEKGVFVIILSVLIYFAYIGISK